MLLSEDLKNAIFHYAMQGKLVKQDANDEPATSLVEKIREKKEKLIKEKKIKQDKNQSYIFRGSDNLFYEKIGNEKPICIEEEVQFEIPNSWEIIRLKDIGIYKKGPFGSSLTKSMFVPKSDLSVKVYEQKNAIQKDATLGHYYITKKYYEEKMSGFTVNPGDIIVSCAGTIGETFIMPDNIELGIINQALMKMEIFAPINIDYFLLYFDYVLKESAKNSSKGAAIKNIPPFDIFKQLLLPLPPFAEQQRIVDKLREIFALVDKYGEKEKKLEEINVNFKNEISQSILQSALKGESSRQLETDSNVEDYIKLAKEIKKEKKQNNLLNNTKKTEDVLDEGLFDIPDTWRWVRLGDIVDFRMGKTPDKTDIKSYGNDYPWVKIGDIENDGTVTSTSVKISEYGFKNTFSEKISPKGTLIMSFKLTIGKVAILDIDALHNEAIISIFPFVEKDNITRDYLFNVLPYISQSGDFKSAIKGKTLNANSLTNLLVPLPPIEEQKRIVDKLNQIMPLVNNLTVQ